MMRVVIYLNIYIVIVTCKGLDHIRLPSSQSVKYVPSDYKKQKTKICPAPSSSNNFGGGFNVWTFLTTGVVAATVAANIVNNVNDNNNNNNNNNNQDNQNNNNQNFNNDDNSNMNMNMLMMAMGRQFMSENRRNNITDYFTSSNYLRKFALCSICESNRLSSSLSNSQMIFGRLLSVTAGFLLDDLFGGLATEEILGTVKIEDCKKANFCL